MPTSEHMENQVAAKAHQMYPSAGESITDEQASINMGLASAYIAGGQYVLDSLQGVIDTSIDETIRLLNDLNARGALDYGDYTELHTSVSNIAPVLTNYSDVLSIVKDSGEWIAGAPITGHQGDVIASSVLPGTTPETIKHWYSAFMGVEEVAVDGGPQGFRVIEAVAEQFPDDEQARAVAEYVHSVLPALLVNIAESLANKMVAERDAAIAGVQAEQAQDGEAVPNADS